VKTAHHVEVVFTGEQYEWLHAHLFQPNDDEQAAYAFAAPAKGPDRLKLLVHHILPLERTDFDIQNGGYLQVSAETARNLVSYTLDSPFSLIEIHSHPFARERVGFSGIDTAEAKPRFDWFAQHTPATFHHVMLVFGTDSADGMIYDRTDKSMRQIGGVMILGHPFKRFAIGEHRGARDRRRDPYSARMIRQTQAFGDDGQTLIAGARVGIVGLGGMGSAVAQQLALLGVRDFVLIDADALETHNLNRFIGGTPRDAARKRMKVDIVADLIRSIDSRARVRTYASKFPTAESAAALKTVDVLFGCVDSHGSRLLLNAFSVQYMLPYIDLGVGINADESGTITESGGQYRVVMPGGFCLDCVRAIDPVAAGQDLLPDDQRKLHQSRGYIPTEDIAAPAVVFLNQTLASLAVGEFLNLFTAYRAPQRLTYYFLHDQSMRSLHMDDRRADCAACMPTGRLARGDLEPVLGGEPPKPITLSTLPSPTHGRSDSA